jgi:prevent-host-death family protein
MRTVNVHEAKTHLSRLLERVAAGEEVVIAKAGRPVARLIAFGETPDQRVLGRDAGLFEVPENFDDPLPHEVATVFEQ